MKVHTPNKLVSVVIPCYNSSATITYCLASVLQQSYKNIEFVLVDDGSTDDTFEKLQQFEKENRNRYQIIITKQLNAGPSTARNIGVEMAHGELIAFIDSDDIWIPEKLMLQMSLYCSLIHQPLLIGAQHPYEKHNINVEGYAEITLNKLLWSNVFQTSSVLVQKKALLKNKFNQHQKYSEDYDVWLALASQGKCLLMNRALTISTTRSFSGNGLSSNLWEMEKWELKNFATVLRKGHITWYEYCFFSIYSLFKFLRRALVSLI
jgi:glycosyltransferase involved in cell wall biosynthesis